MGRYYRNEETGRFRAWTEEEREEFQLEKVQEQLEDAASDDALADVWNNSVVEFLGGTEDLYEFAVADNGAELFLTGWGRSEEESEEDRINAREEFFELMEAYDISRDEFDWDAWRDWYEDA